jgi:transposase
LAVHKAGIEEASAAAGASLLYLRRHGPDLHRIERFLAKLKALLADTGEPPFSVPGD